MRFDLHDLTGGLKHYHYDIFQVAEGAPGLEGTKLTFLMNQAGEIDRVTIALFVSSKSIFRR